MILTVISRCLAVFFPAAALIVAGCGPASLPTTPSLDSANPKERLQAVKTLANKHGATP